MEKILIHKNIQIENLAHEIAMTYVKEDFKNNFRVGMIKNCNETGWMLNAYYQAKKKALNVLANEYEIVDVE